MKYDRVVPDSKSSFAWLLARSSSRSITRWRVAESAIVSSMILMLLSASGLGSETTNDTENDATGFANVVGLAQEDARICHKADPELELALSRADAALPEIYQSFSLSKEQLLIDEANARVTADNLHARTYESPNCDALHKQISNIESWMRLFKVR